MLLIVLIIGVVAALVGFIWVLIDHNTFKMEQNIYFTEFDSDIDKPETAIFKYDPVKGKLIELVKVPDKLVGCVIDKGENRITGFLYELFSQGGHRIGIIEYDINTGTVTEKNVIEKIDELTGDPSWGGTLYDGGNKILVSYTDKEDVERLLSYDMETGKYENELIRGSQIRQYPAINEQALWYRLFNTIYRYDWQTKAVNEVSYFSEEGALEPNAGLIAYTEDIHEIFLYDIDRNETSCIAPGGWNITYGDLSWTNAMWTSDGRQFCYVKYFPTLFGAGDTSMMIYDLESGRHRCIYKVKVTYNEFRYIPLSELLTSIIHFY